MDLELVGMGNLELVGMIPDLVAGDWGLVVVGKGKD